MAVADLTASVHPEGNRVDLRWTNPDSVTLPGARVIRREGAFPVGPEPVVDRDGVVIADTDPTVVASGVVDLDPDGTHRVSNGGLHAERVYYYRVFAYSGSPAVYELQPIRAVSAMATGANGFTDLMLEFLPSVFKRYDTVLPGDVLDPTVVASMAAADQTRGQLHRFLDLIGGQFNQQYSAVRSLRDLLDVSRVDGRLLPLIAEWIGWESDFGLGFDGQRREIANAPAIYHGIQNIATVESTVRRISGWEARSKEFVDNVAATNRPERLNLWLADSAGGTWTPGEQPLSLDYCYEGRPATVTEPTARRVFYHTRKGERWDIWQKSHTDADGWTGSVPVVSRAGTVDKDPAAVLQGATVWLFWTVYDEASDRWRIDFRTEELGIWSAMETFELGPNDTTQRRSPKAMIDSDDALWLLWMELVADRWRLRFQRFTGVPFAPTPGGAFDFPDDGAADPRVEADVFVLARDPQPADPADPFRRIWVLWARQEPVPGQPEQTRFRVVSRFKDGVDPADMSDWGPIEMLPIVDDIHHDREPAAMIDSNGDLRLFWSTTRDGGWSVHGTTLDATTQISAAPVAATNAVFSERAPLPLALPTGMSLLYRSNASVSHVSSIYRGTETIDARYSGTTTVRAADGAKIALRTGYDDFATYTYDAGPASGRTDADLYARDTLGLYLVPDTADPAELAARQIRLKRVLTEFMPATDRAILALDV